MGTAAQQQLWVWMQRQKDSYGSGKNRQGEPPFCAWSEMMRSHGYDANDNVRYLYEVVFAGGIVSMNECKVIEEGLGLVPDGAAYRILWEPELDPMGGGDDFLRVTHQTPEDWFSGEHQNFWHGAPPIVLGMARQSGGLKPGTAGYTRHRVSGELIKRLYVAENRMLAASSYAHTRHSACRLTFQVGQRVEHKWFGVVFGVEGVGRRDNGKFYDGRSAKGNHRPPRAQVWFDEAAGCHIRFVEFIPCKNPHIKKPGPVPVFRSTPRSRTPQYRCNHEEVFGGPQRS